DIDLNYRYKAHGAPLLALKRGMERDMVISPYSAFLALMVDFPAAVKDLRGLSAMGAEGRYGMCEALDFTPSRQAEGQFRAVRSYMSHHLGMSILSVANVLCDGIFQRRFMADREMASCAELLEERMPLGQVVLKKPSADIPEKPVRNESADWAERGEWNGNLLPRCCLLSNGAYSLVMSENGQSLSGCRGISVNTFSGDATDPDSGIFMLLDTGNGMLPLLPMSGNTEGARYGWEFSGSRARFNCIKGTLTCTTDVSVSADETGELRTVNISCESSEREFALYVGFSPVLEGKRAYDSHPAYMRLSLEGSVKGNTLLIRRRSRDGINDRYAAFAFGCRCGFGLGSPFRRGGMDDSRLLYGSGQLADPEFRVFAKSVHGCKDGAVTVSFAIAIASDPESAEKKARRILGGAEASSMTEKAAISLAMNRQALSRTMGRLSGLLYHEPCREEYRSFSRGQEGLWRYGISGDLPVLAVIAEKDGGEELAVNCVKEHLLLSACGVKQDLIILTEDGSDYRQPCRQGVLECLRAAGSDGELDAYGGVHIVDMSDNKACAVLSACDVLVVKGEETTGDERCTADIPVRASAPGNERVKYGFEDDWTFRFSVKSRLPDCAWSNILTNGRFSYIAADAGTGNMWIDNAREGRINSWINDPSALEGPERLELILGGERISLFAAEDGYDSAVEFAPGLAKWERKIKDVRTKLCCFVPPDLNCRIMTLELGEGFDEGRLLWGTDLVLG
ncbi:MAG: hypothetical protein IJG63_07605, partial [Oscillospiraceae bacterium]|nr:hypothetical protein [Oscillospiraceae bacterium]